MNQPMTFLEARIPPPIVGLLCACAMWIVAKHTSALDVSRSSRIAAALVLGGIGLSVMLSGVLSFRFAKTTVNPLKPETATALVTSGVYRFTRNPMYLGMLILLVAWGSYLASPMALTGAVLFWLFIGRFQIRPEERALRDLFGETYAGYTSKVRRWL
jgi:protein-S-isoprenylcysteine O-methyltransferase Ste14